MKSRKTKNKTRKTGVSIASGRNIYPNYFSINRNFSGIQQLEIMRMRAFARTVVNALF